MGLFNNLFGGLFGRRTQYRRPQYRRPSYGSTAAGVAGMAMIGTPMYLSQGQRNPNQYRPTAYHQQVASRVSQAPAPFFETARLTGNMPDLGEDPQGYLRDLRRIGSHVPRYPTATSRAGVFGDEYAKDGYNLYKGDGKYNPRFTGVVRTPQWDLWNQAGNDRYRTGFTMANWDKGADRSKDMPREALYSGYARALRDAEGEVIEGEDGNPIFTEPVDFYQRGDGTWVLGYPTVDETGKVIPGKYDRVEHGGKDDKWLDYLRVNGTPREQYLAERQARLQAAQEAANGPVGEGLQTDTGTGTEGDQLDPSMFESKPAANQLPPGVVPQQYVEGMGTGSTQGFEASELYGDGTARTPAQEQELLFQIAQGNSYQGFGVDEGGQSVFQGDAGGRLQEIAGPNMARFQQEGLTGQFNEGTNFDQVFEDAQFHGGDTLQPNTPFFHQSGEGQYQLNAWNEVPTYLAGQRDHWQGRMDHWGTQRDVANVNRTGYQAQMDALGADYDQSQAPWTTAQNGYNTANQNWETANTNYGVAQGNFDNYSGLHDQAMELSAPAAGSEVPPGQ